MSDETIVLDTPDRIRAFGLLQIYHKLKMEVAHPGGPKWRVSPMKQAKAVLEAAGRPSASRKAKVLEQYKELLEELGVLS